MEKNQKSLLDYFELQIEQMEHMTYKEREALLAQIRREIRRRKLVTPIQSSIYVHHPVHN